MREGIEKLNSEEEKKKPVIEELQEIKAKEEATRKEDKLYASPWHVINPEDLTPENLELYKQLRTGTEASLKAASVEAEVVKEQIEQIKNKDEKQSNKEFTKWVNKKRENTQRSKTLERERAQDNTR